jgi:hypothetical protein
MMAVPVRFLPAPLRHNHPAHQGKRNTTADQISPAKRLMKPVAQVAAADSMTAGVPYRDSLLINLTGILKALGLARCFEYRYG